MMLSFSLSNLPQKFCASTMFCSGLNFHCQQEQVRRMKLIKLICPRFWIDEVVVCLTRWRQCLQQQLLARTCTNRQQEETKQHLRPSSKALQSLPHHKSYVNNLHFQFCVFMQAQGLINISFKLLKACSMNYSISLRFILSFFNLCPYASK